MREDAEGIEGDGVSPSSDLTSCKVNGSAVKSSAIPSSEFTAGKPGLFEVCDHTALRCSGSGPLAVGSFPGVPKDARVHGAGEDIDLES